MKNIRILTLSISSFLFASQAHALATFGLKGGLGVSMDRTDNPTGSIPSIGYMGGASAEFGLGPVAILTEAFYLMNKTRIGADSNNYGEVSANSLLIPVQAKISMLGILSFTGGMYWNYGIGKITSRVVSGGDELSDDSVSYEDADIKKSSFGAIAGIGLGLPLGVTTLSVEARLRYGLTALEDTDNTKTTAVDVLVGFTF